MGSLLIQSDDHTGEPLLLHLMLPTCIRQRHLARKSFVFLLDAQIGTGAAAFMAIRVLRDHGVPEENIVFVTFVVAAAGGVRVGECRVPWSMRTNTRKARLCSRAELAFGTLTTIPRAILAYIWFFGIRPDFLSDSCNSSCIDTMG